MPAARRRLSTFSLVFALASSIPAFAGAIITYGNTSLGVNDQGHLNFSGLGPGGFGTYGVYRAGVGDAIAPGCLCEGWGVAVTGSGGRTSGWASIDNGGIGGLGATGTFGSTTSTATSSVSLSGAPLTVQHSFGPSLAADVFQVQVSITNTGSDPLMNLVFRRSMDWDVPPTTFSELVTHKGVAANLTSNGGNVLYASDNGFANSNPLVGAGSIQPGTINTDFTKSGPDDHGSVFDFAFGDLAPGATRIFNIFYGSRESEASAFSALSQLGVASGTGAPLPGGLYSLGQPSNGSPGTFLFAFGGVGGVEPGETPELPILPFVPAPGQYVFTNPIPRRWYDPPLTDAWTVSLAGGEFLGVGAPPASFGYGPMELVVNGIVVDPSFLPDEIYNFAAGVSEFTIRNINPLHDTADTSAFPLWLDFTAGPGANLTWTANVADEAIPEPGTFVLLGASLLAGLVPGVRKRILRH